MTASEILEELRPLGRDGYKNVLLRHGAAEPCWGVKIEELKKLQKRIRKDYRLALDLFDTGLYDAMYLAGLIADDARMTRRDLQHWVEKACAPIACTTVASVAAGGPFAREIALEWIDSNRDSIAATGWATLSGWISITDDSQLDIAELKLLLDRVARSIHASPNLTRYQMNGFVIAAGCFVPALTPHATAVGASVGKVSVDMGDTDCQVPFAPDYIRKVEARGRLGKKRKSAKC